MTDPQTTPVHLKLWHHDFWAVMFSVLLLTSSVYMFVPLWFDHLVQVCHFSGPEVSFIPLGYGIGLFSLGGFCSYLVQVYRRHRVCMLMMLLLSLCLLGYFGISYFHLRLSHQALLVGSVANAFLTGAFYGLAQMILSSTLVIDTCESDHRTIANHSAVWFSRFALSLGPVLALVVYHYFSMAGVSAVAALLAVLSCVLIQLVDFPFRAPGDNLSKFSLDRFLLSTGFLMFINLMLIASVVGLVLTSQHDIRFYGLMMLGFFLALLSEKFVFDRQDYRAGVLLGGVGILVAMWLLMVSLQLWTVLLAAVCFGFGAGLVSGRHLLLFIQLSQHCQRGTSQSTFFLAWELGIALGLAGGYGLFIGDKHTLLLCGIGVLVLALLLFDIVTYPWYRRHRHR